jgi:hypothetical protein
MIAISFQSAMQPAEIIDALRTRMPLWRESELTPYLRSSGILSIDAKIRDLTCVAEYSHSHRGPETMGTMGLRLRATVVALPDTGSRIDTQVRYESPHNIWIGIILAALFVFVGSHELLVPDWWIVSQVLAIAALLYAFQRDANLGLSRKSEPAADFLVHRLELALRVTEPS